MIKGAFGFACTPKAWRGLKKKNFYSFQIAKFDHANKFVEQTHLVWCCRWILALTWKHNNIARWNKIFCNYFMKGEGWNIYWFYKVKENIIFFNINVEIRHLDHWAALPSLGVALLPFWNLLQIYCLSLPRLLQPISRRGRSTDHWRRVLPLLLNLSCKSRCWNYNHYANIKARL